MFEVADNCTFFGQVDKTPKIDKITGESSNEIGSSYPCYMHEPQIEKLKESISEKEVALDSGAVHPVEVEATKRRLQQERVKLAQIEDSKPRITPEMYKKISTELDTLGGEISSAMFTEIDMQKGHADPQQEASRMRNACVPVDRELAMRCNIRVDDRGKATRSEAEKMWKILTWLKTDGEGYLNTDTLRRRMGGSVAPKSRLMRVPVGFDEDGKIIKEEAPLTSEGQNVSIDHELENKEQKASKVSDAVIEKWTCPDCGIEMKARAKAIHNSRYCKVKNEKKKEAVTT